MSNLATCSDFSVQLQSDSYSNCSTKISKAVINSQPALFILLLIFFVLFLICDTEESTIFQSMCAVFLLTVFSTILLSQCADLVLLHLVTEIQILRTCHLKTDEQHLLRNVF